MSMTKHSNMSIVIKKKLGKRIPVAISLQSLHTFDLFSTQPKYVFDFKELVRSYLVELFTKLFSHFDFWNYIHPCDQLTQSMEKSSHICLCLNQKDYSPQESQ